MNPADRKNQFLLWCLYSFGNSIIFVVFVFYFSQWLVVVEKVSDLYLNLCYVAASLLFLLALPIIGTRADKTKKRLGLFRSATFGLVIVFTIVAFIALLAPSHPFATIPFFVLGVFFYLVESTYWNALLVDLAPPEHRGVVAGWGAFSDWLGEISGVLAGVVIIYFLGSQNPAAIPVTLLFSVVVFLILCLPLLFKLKENPVENDSYFGLETYKTAWRDFRMVAVGGLGWFLLAFFFFNDAIITASNNFSVYLSEVFGVSQTAEAILTAAVLASAALGSIIAGRAADRFGPRQTLLFILGGWIIILPVIAATTNFPIFIIIALIMGLWFGSVWTVARILTAKLSPPSALNRAFSYYILMERFATLVGPIGWGLVVAFGPTLHGLNYRLALLSMTAFVVVGFLVARKIPKS